MKAEKEKQNQSSDSESSFQSDSQFDSQASSKDGKAQAFGQSVDSESESSQSETLPNRNIVIEPKVTKSNTKAKNNALKATIDPNQSYEKMNGYNGGRESASTAARTTEK